MNKKGQNVGLYIPRIITAKNHDFVQLNIGHIDENGIYTGHFCTFALSDFLRAQLWKGSSINHIPL
ncbi:hypothetical protein MKW92_037774 [Papaver armeniacum]|nr:hypothetical protein MKW92_037774 [Papaver armeniacum]